MYCNQGSVQRIYAALSGMVSNVMQVAWYLPSGMDAQVGGM
jgi:hypothetical protein